MSMKTSVRFGFVLLIVFFFTCSGSAQSHRWDLWANRIVINPNGDIVIEEYWEVFFSGETFSSLSRAIPVGFNNDGIQVDDTTVEEVGDDGTSITYTRSSSDDSSPYTFNVAETEYEDSINIFFHDTIGSKTWRLGYTMNGVVEVINEGQSYGFTWSVIPPLHGGIILETNASVLFPEFSEITSVSITPDSSEFEIETLDPDGNFTYVHFTPSVTLGIDEEYEIQVLFENEHINPSNLWQNNDEEETMPVVEEDDSIHPVTFILYYFGVQMCILHICGCLCSCIICRIYRISQKTKNKRRNNDNINNIDFLRNNHSKLSIFELGYLFKTTKARVSVAQLISLAIRGKVQICVEYDEKSFTLRRGNEMMKSPFLMGYDDDDEKNNASIADFVNNNIESTGTGGSLFETAVHISDDDDDDIGDVVIRREQNLRYSSNKMQPVQFSQQQQQQEEESEGEIEMNEIQINELLPNENLQESSNSNIGVQPLEKEKNDDSFLETPQQQQQQPQKSESQEYPEEEEEKVKKDSDESSDGLEEGGISNLEEEEEEPTEVNNFKDIMKNIEDDDEDYSESIEDSFLNFAFQSSSTEEDKEDKKEEEIATQIKNEVILEQKRTPYLEKNMKELVREVKEHLRKNRYLNKALGFTVGWCLCWGYVFPIINYCCCLFIPGMILSFIPYNNITFTVGMLNLLVLSCAWIGYCFIPGCTFFTFSRDSYMKTGKAISVKSLLTKMKKEMEKSDSWPVINSHGGRAEDNLDSYLPYAIILGTEKKFFDSHVKKDDDDVENKKRVHEKGVLERYIFYRPWFLVPRGLKGEEEEEKKESFYSVLQKKYLRGLLMVHEGPKERKKRRRWKGRDL